MDALATRHRRLFGVTLPLIVAALLATFVPGVALAEERQSLPPNDAAPAALPDQRAVILENFRNDAALADVCFLDRNIGWVVGDRGVIWHTEDGGANWRAQNSGVTCRLNSVTFIDARHGWIVGGECRPYSQSTRGVVLRTIDGGATWHSIPRLVLPLLKRVQFFDAHRGVAIGERAAHQPSGTFITHDGGDTWQPLPTDRAGGWLTGDFLDPDTGAVAGRAGQFATLARRQIVRSPLATPALHSFRAMRLIAPTGGWLVGDGGTVMITRDLGRSWQSPPTDLPEAVVNHFDLHAVAVHGTHVWVAGAPGTRVFHSPDNGQTWQSSPTGQTAPLSALTFIDAEHGWAVGELGNILATADGGKSWQHQHSGAKRAALHAVFADPRDVPLELLADAGTAEGYIASVDILHTTAAEQIDSDRTRDAMLSAGAATASVAWRFPLPPEDLALAPADILAALNRANDGRAIERIERHLVRSLRMWRPDVVMTHPPSLEQNDPRSAVLATLLMRAIEAAADSARHPELAADVGLPAWQVKKVYGLLPPDARGNESLATARFSPWLGTTPAEFVAPARQLLDAAHITPPATYEFELLASHIDDSSGPRGLFSGIAIEADARRQRPQLPVNDVDHLRRLATRRRHLEQLLDQRAGGAAWAAQVANLTDGLSTDPGAALLMQLADGYRTNGHLDLAADTYYLLARRYPDHALADRALAWLVHFYASSEAAHYASHSVARALVRANSPAERTEVRATSFDETTTSTPATGLSRDDRLRRAAQLTEYLKTSRPALYAEPATRFAEVAAQRQLGFTNPATRYFLELRQLPESDLWRQYADTEQWLAQPADLPPPRPFAACRPAAQPPHLDGRLDEPFWSTADRLRLRGDSVGQTILSVDQISRGGARTDRNVRPTNEPHLRLAYDREHLYLAIHCPKAPGVEYRTDDSPRPRDADLRQHDRVTLRLDIDRDFTTALELTVDSRGWTHDDCWGDVHWNPAWYVAAASDETSWTIEAAIPLTELTPIPPAARHVWAISARRTIPRTGYQAWPADAEERPQFGFLLFD